MKSIKLKHLFLVTIFLTLGVIVSCDNSKDSSETRLESSMTVNNDMTVTDETTPTEVTDIRETGAPETVIFTFTATSGDGVARVINGGLYEPFGERVSSATITLNGAEIFTQSDFNQNVAEVSKDVTLLEGDNILSVTLSSSPGAKVTIQITQ